MSPAILRDLHRVCGTVCTLSYKLGLFHAASLLALFRALRISELVVLSKSDHSGMALVHSNVVMYDGCLVITITASKTDQVGVGRQVVLEGCGEA